MRKYSALHCFMQELFIGSLANAHQDNQVFPYILALSPYPRPPEALQLNHTLHALQISFYLRALLNDLLCLNDLLIDRFSLSMRNIPHTLSYLTKDHC
ncbi:hypothetical protein [Paenibacillus glacialis]|uniref:Uncharacterized protein n=1 Tax=Paenibacillus glacialis TaxID=494026 RepID=A0A162K2A1_9BACL|nr:hypothetical protein [Paenibacillus glacialis]OAB41956.1 hypothetical protein PGLA_14120 [Paenibacillus glacialis]